MLSSRGQCAWDGSDRPGPHGSHRSPVPVETTRAGPRRAGRDTPRCYEGRVAGPWSGVGWPRGAALLRRERGAPRSASPTQARPERSGGHAGARRRPVRRLYAPAPTSRALVVPSTGERTDPAPSDVSEVTPTVSMGSSIALSGREDSRTLARSGKRGDLWTPRRASRVRQRDDHEPANDLLGLRVRASGTSVVPRAASPFRVRRRKPTRRRSQPLTNGARGLAYVDSPRRGCGPRAVMNEISTAIIP